MGGAAVAGLSGKQQLLVRVSFLCNVMLCIIKIVAAISSGSFAVRSWVCLRACACVRWSPWQCASVE